VHAAARLRPRLAEIEPALEASMQHAEQTVRNVTVVPVAGRLDSHTAPRLGERLDELLHAGRALLLIEASELQYIGSAGLRALLVAGKRAAEQGGSLVLCGMTSPVHRMVEVAGLDGVLKTYPSRDDALAKLSSAKLVAC
jgi:anti-sigma B factor antagonist